MANLTTEINSHCWDGVEICHLVLMWSFKVDLFRGLAGELIFVFIVRVKILFTLFTLLWLFSNIKFYDRIFVQLFWDFLQFRFSFEGKQVVVTFSLCPQYIFCLSREKCWSNSIKPFDFSISFQSRNGIIS